MVSDHTLKNRTGENMIYTFESRVRYSEIGEDQKLTLNSIVNYFQDCSTFQSEEIGLGVNALAQRQQVWLLLSWQICVDRYPKLGEKIAVKTWAYDFKGFYGHRNFLMEDEDGNRLAYANSLWGFIDLKTNRPMLVPEEEISGYQFEEKLDMDYAPRKIKIPKESRKMESFQVRQYHLDTNHHVNNGQYVRMAMEMIPRDFKIRQMRAEYKLQAYLGDMVYPQISKIDNTYTIVLDNQENKPYVIVEFME